jgi:ATP-dependent protease ClpP protease subunit
MGFRVTLRDNHATVNIFGEIGLFSDGKAEDLLVAIGDASEVEMFINCHGGDSRFAFDAITGLQGRKLSTYATMAYSAGCVLFAAGEKRYISPNASLMIHSACGAEYSTPRGLREAAARLEETNQKQIDLFTRATGQPCEVIQRLVAGDEDHYFTASEAISFGLATEILKPFPSDTAVEQNPVANLQQVEAGPTEDEEFLLSVLRAIGQIETRDRPRLLRNISAWIDQVKQI